MIWHLFDIFLLIKVRLLEVLLYDIIQSANIMEIHHKAYCQSAKRQQECAKILVKKTEASKIQNRPNNDWWQEDMAHKCAQITVDIF